MGNKNDAFGNRMKSYEPKGRLMPLLPAIARLDGKCFSKWTRGLEKPYDLRFMKIMQKVTKILMEKTNAKMGYTQSDEITLAWYSDDRKSQIYRDGKIQKMVSDLSALASIYFNHYAQEFFKDKPLATFDCRVWNVPNLDEGANAFLWREKDATKNSIQSAASSVYSHKVLYKKTCNQMQEMLFQDGINWNDYPADFKRGVFFQRRKVSTTFSTEELDRLPAKHEARSNPDLKVIRNVIIKLDMPPFTTVINRPEVIFLEGNPELDNRYDGRKQTDTIIIL